MASDNNIYIWLNISTGNSITHRLFWGSSARVLPVASCFAVQSKLQFTQRSGARLQWSFWLDIQQTFTTNPAVSLKTTVSYMVWWTPHHMMRFHLGSGNKLHFQWHKAIFFSFSNCASWDTSLTIFCKFSPYIPSYSSNEPVDGRWIQFVLSLDTKTTERVVW